MLITNVVKVLNTEYKMNLDTTYYEYIAMWENWWKGLYKPFHQYQEKRADGRTEVRDMYTMKMAKKVCEDWASILLNEQTQITIDDKNSAEFVHGEDGKGGVLGENGFAYHGNALIERAFATGTGAAVLRFEGMKVRSDGKTATVEADAETRIGIEYLPASSIIPITVRRGKIIDVAFVSEFLLEGRNMVYVETHMRKAGGYEIRNRYYEAQGDVLTPAELPEGVAEVMTFKTDRPLFAIIRPNVVNNVNPVIGLGMSIYANAIDNLKGIDLAFHNLCRDFKLGGKKVFINEVLTTTTPDGRRLTPDDVAQQLFYNMGGTSFDNEKALISEYNPTLRVDENVDGIQAQLDYFSFKCGLGARFYRFNSLNKSNGTVTATQYIGEKQDLIQHAHKHYLAAEAFLRDLVRAILWAGKNICGQPVNPDAAIKIDFDDSYIVGKEAERERDRQDVRDGFLLPWEYRVKWYGETEEEAKAILDSVNVAGDDIMGYLDVPRAYSRDATK